MKSIRLTNKRIVAIAISLIAIACVAHFSTFRSGSICNVCGATQSETDWQFPLTSLTYWSSTAVRSTPLRETTERLHLCPPHQHQFIFIQGSGNGVLCAIGQGRHFAAAATHSQWSVFIANLAAYRGAAIAEHWLVVSLTPDGWRPLSMLLSDFPDAGFRSQGEYDEWWTKNKELIAMFGPDGIALSTTRP
ncbi:hypothetical protein BH10PLA1_BH10PLA1_19260 [soil metagenome]